MAVAIGRNHLSLTVSSFTITCIALASTQTDIQGIMIEIGLDEISADHGQLNRNLLNRNRSAACGCQVQPSAANVLT